MDTCTYMWGKLQLGLKRFNTWNLGEAMTHSKAALDFWDRVKEETGIRGGFQDAWGFGDNPRLTDEPLGLVLEDKKRTTTTLVKEMEIEGYPEPKEGEYSVMLDGSGEPRAVIRTASVRRAKFRRRGRGTRLLGGRRRPDPGELQARAYQVLQAAGRGPGIHLLGGHGGNTGAVRVGLPA